MLCKNLLTPGKRPAMGDSISLLLEEANTTLGRHVTFPSPSRKKLYVATRASRQYLQGGSSLPGLIGVKGRDTLPPGRCHQTRHLGPMAA